MEISFSIHDIDHVPKMKCKQTDRKIGRPKRQSNEKKGVQNIHSFKILFRPFRHTQ